MSDVNINIVPKFLDNMLSPIAKEAGEALADIIRIARIPLSDYLKKHEVKLNHALETLKKELETIPEENIVKPKTAVVGPALEEMFKYYLEEDDIVESFSKLIAASMDKERSDYVHPQMFFAVKQMSPFDSKIFHSIIRDSFVYPAIFSVKLCDAFDIIHVNYFEDFTKSFVLLEPKIFDEHNIELKVKAYNSLLYLSNLGLIKECHQTNLLLKEKHDFFVSNLKPRIEIIMKEINPYFAEISGMKQKIIVSMWLLTEQGQNLANALKINVPKF